MAYSQAPIEMDMYMELPTGIPTKHMNSKDHVLKLLANIYKQKQAGRIWNNHLIIKLQEINFKQSLIDDCIFYWDNVFFIVYIDDGGIFLGSSDKQLHGIINKLSYSTSSCPLKIKVTLRIMLELTSRSSRTASLNCHNKPSLTPSLPICH
jgi:hypothetical protein